MYISFMDFTQSLLKASAQKAYSRFQALFRDRSTVSRPPVLFVFSSETAVFLDANTNRFLDF
jgi:hypothetical protein